MWKWKDEIFVALKSFKDIDARNQAILDRIVSTDYPNSKKFVDLAGMTFGYLHVDRYHGKDAKSEAYSWCTCKCGNKLLVRNRQLLNHRVSSCGCRISELVFKRNKENIKHTQNNYINITNTICTIHSISKSIS